MLVLAPTRELAGQIVEDARPLARARGLEVAAVYGGVGFETQIRAARRAHMLVATPGRLEDLMARGAVSLAHVRILVLDEADRMLDMGFRPAVDRIVARVPGRRQTLFFSATLDGEAGRVADAYTRDPLATSTSPRRRRRRRSRTASSPSSTSTSCRRLIAELRRDDGLRWCSCARSAAPTGSSSGSRSAGVTPSRCTATSPSASASRRSPASRRGDVRTLVATDVAARGIDVDGIAHVINFDPPADREGYVHRVGRTGPRRPQRPRHDVRARRGRARGRPDRGGARAPRRVRGRRLHAPRASQRTAAARSRAVAPALGSPALRPLRPFEHGDDAH